MSVLPFVKTSIGEGRLIKIEGDNAVIEMDFEYLVKLPLSEVDLTGVDLSTIPGMGAKPLNER